MYIAHAAQMRELDRLAIESLGIPGMVLMENAGRGTVQFMVDQFGPIQGKHVAIFVGPGNNGGDGLVIARTVLNHGGCPLLYILVQPEQLGGDAGINFSIIEKMGLRYRVLESGKHVSATYEHIMAHHRRSPVHSIVDALFGTGLARDIEGHFLDALHCMNSLSQQEQIPLIAADMPSGIHSDTGATLGGAVQADMTVTYGLPKPAHFHNGGQGMGTLRVVDIGIPSQLYPKVHLKGMALTSTTIPTLAGKPTNAHKGSNGHLLILAGSTGKTGAAILAGTAALRAGTGLVSLAVPHDLNPVFEISLQEAMTIPLPHSQGILSEDDLHLLLDTSANMEGVVLGPGIGTDPSTAKLVLQLYQSVSAPMVIDADALNILSDHPEVITNPGGARILTPHPGEMARLCHCSIDEVQKDRLQTVNWQKHYAGDHEIITLLKGAGTVLGSSSGDWAINTSGNPGMATGGMGDVLAGVIGSLLVQGYAPWDAACLGAFLHGYSADVLAQNQPYGYLASEVAHHLPAIMKELSE